MYLLEGSAARLGWVVSAAWWGWGSGGLLLCVKGAGQALALARGAADTEPVQSCWARERPPCGIWPTAGGSCSLSCPAVFELAACILEMFFPKLTGILFLGNKHVLPKHHLLVHTVMASWPTSPMPVCRINFPARAARLMFLRKRKRSTLYSCPSNGTSTNTLLLGSPSLENIDSYRSNLMPPLSQMMPPHRQAGGHAPGMPHSPVPCLLWGCSRSLCLPKCHRSHWG